MNHSYDPSLDTEDTALRALYRLYTQARWDLLEEVGVCRDPHKDVLDATCVDMGRKLTEDDLHKLRKACPFLLNAGSHLRDRYRFVTMFRFTGEQAIEQD